MFKYQNGQKVKVDEKEVVEGFEMPDMNKNVMNVPLWGVGVAVVVVLVGVWAWKRRRHGKANMSLSSSSDGDGAVQAFRFY